MDSLQTSTNNGDGVSSDENAWLLWVDLDFELCSAAGISLVSTKGRFVEETGKEGAEGTLERAGGGILRVG